MAGHGRVALRRREIPRPRGSSHLDTLVFEEEDGKTTVTTTVLYGSQQIRDAVLESGMATGVAESYDVLEELLAS